MRPYDIRYITCIRNTYRILAEKSEGKRWEDNINMNLKEMEYVGVDLIYLAQDTDGGRALVNMTRKLHVP
jgi:hypothetical protein